MFIFISRPRSVKDVVFQDEVVRVLAKTIQGADVSLALVNEWLHVCAHSNVQ